MEIFDKDKFYEIDEVAILLICSKMGSPFQFAYLVLKQREKFQASQRNLNRIPVLGHFAPITLIWNTRYCPLNNTTQANPYKSQGSGYPVDPSE